ncbi:Low-affinity potassium transport protein [Erysiphe neolycopersici]|uniref:Low-affinity potassium transport protein n=1 Tax=Erysiphe neolycopersici TaxID=212602 RepID=A0A420HHX8_9PEZI|nr:Low-affinity potassium transport protein [Erysiphe neolycopersici]
MAAIEEGLASTLINFRSQLSWIQTSARNIWHQFFKKPTFLQLHWVYFILTCLISSLLFHLFSTININYVDSLFMVIGSMTQTGLNTVNMSDLNFFQQSLIMILSMIGSPIVVSIIVILVRKRAFQKRFKTKKREEEKRYHTSLTTSISSSFIANLDDHNEGRVRNGFVSGVQNIVQLVIKSNRLKDNRHVDRNAQFHGLSLEERECVHCVEYKAVELLGYVVTAYYVIWQFLGCIVLGTYLSTNYTEAISTNGFNSWWLGISLAIGAFNNSGISLLDNSVIPFGDSSYILLNMSLLMLAGNTAFPILLRWILRQILNLIPDTEKYEEWRETLSFILKFPRRVYTNLFSSEHTWCLLALLIFFNAFDWTIFEIFNHYSTEVSTMSTKSIILDGFFQTVSMRSSGFTVIPISSLFIGLQTLYVIMMYISEYPITITMRSSNVYEERSLGIYARELHNSDNIEKTGGISDLPMRRRDRFYFVQEQFRRQLTHDLWFLVIGALMIISIESSNFNRDPQTFSIFNIIFEIVSAYGGVGLSVGLPGKTYSFCGGWHNFSRLILCAIMLRGRHRGLPVDIDKAIQLPGDKLDFAEEQDHRIRAISSMAYHL